MKKYINAIMIVLCAFLHANSSFAFYRKAAQHYLPRMGCATVAGVVGALNVEAFLNRPCPDNREETARRSDRSWECIKGISGFVGTYCLWGLARIAGFRRVRAPGIKLEQLQHRFVTARKASSGYYPSHSRRDLQVVLGELRSLQRELSPVQTEFEVREDDKQYTCLGLRKEIDRLEEEVDDTLKQIDGR